MSNHTTVTLFCWSDTETSSHNYPITNSLIREYSHPSYPLQPNIPFLHITVLNISYPPKNTNPWTLLIQRTNISPKHGTQTKIYGSTPLIPVPLLPTRDKSEPWPNNTEPPRPSTKPCTCILPARMALTSNQNHTRFFPKPDPETDDSPPV